MIDLCSVVFRDEIDILRVQARSIDRYCSYESINNIFIIVNDSDDWCSAIDCSWWKKFSNKVKVVPRSVFHNSWSHNGWLSQQVLKLQISAFCTSQWYMVLDAKTLFVRPLDLSTLFVNEKWNTGYLEIYPVFEKSKHIAESIFEIVLAKQLGPGGVPFVMHSQTVREMLIDCEQLTAQKFANWFQDQGMLTEFILYSAYIIRQYKTFDHFYSSQCDLPVMNICHSEVQSFERKFQSISTSNPLTVSIHRHAWVNLTHDQQQQWMNFLHSRDLA